MILTENQLRKIVRKELSRSKKFNITESMGLLGLLMLTSFSGGNEAQNAGFSGSNVQKAAKEKAKQVLKKARTEMEIKILPYAGKDMKDWPQPKNKFASPPSMGIKKEYIKLLFLYPGVKRTIIAIDTDGNFYERNEKMAASPRERDNDSLDATGRLDSKTRANRNKIARGSDGKFLLPPEGFDKIKVDFSKFNFAEQKEENLPIPFFVDLIISKEPTKSNSFILSVKNKIIIKKDEQIKEFRDAKERHRDQHFLTDDNYAGKGEDDHADTLIDYLNDKVFKNKKEYSKSSPIINARATVSAPGASPGGTSQKSNIGNIIGSFNRPIVIQKALGFEAQGVPGVKPYPKEEDLKKALNDFYIGFSEYLMDWPSYRKYGKFFVSTKNRRGYWQLIRNT